MDDRPARAKGDEQGGAASELARMAPPRNPERRRETFYHAGEACLAQGLQAEARRWFEESVVTGVVLDPDAPPITPMNEYERARWRLDGMIARQGRASAERPG